MLDDRKTAILSAVVQEYIATALPVGSTHIADAPGVRVSSATVRNEMAVLEQEGYLTQPHTSAGRIPTDKGYRFFVDHLVAPGRLDQATRAQVGDFFRTAHGRLEEMLHRTSDLLAHLTNYAAVVVGPRAEALAVRNVQVVALSSTVATVVVVLGNGTVESETIELAPDINDGHLAAASAHLTAQLSGQVLGSVSDIVPTGDDVVDAVCGTAWSAVRTGSSADHLYVGGTSAMALSFDAVDIVRNVLRTLEQQFVVVSLLGDLVQRGVSVAIGVEHGVEPLSACSVVVAPIVVDGEPPRLGRRARSDAHELPAGAGHGRGRQRPARPPPGGQLTAMADYYQLLGVSRTASTDDIKRAYRQKARELHPDANAGDDATAERFKEVARAYEVLSDPEQRARYDRFGEAGVGARQRPARRGHVRRRWAQRPVRRVLRRAEPVRRRGVAPRAGRAAARSGHGGRRRRHVRAGGVRRHDPRRAEAAPALRGLRRARRWCRHPAGDVRRLWRQRPGPAGPPEPARADGHERLRARAAAGSAR